MPSENELVEKMVTAHTSPSIAELVDMKFLSLWIQDVFANAILTRLFKETPIRF
ncbi:MAG: hypothetical protein PHY05_13305 [Methanothrix sp.]|nr:hypothetical protein [Methanothrix sp.]